MLSTCPRDLLGVSAFQRPERPMEPMFLHPSFYTHPLAVSVIPIQKAERHPSPYLSSPPTSPPRPELSASQLLVLLCSLKPPQRPLGSSSPVTTHPASSHPNASPRIASRPLMIWSLAPHGATSHLSEIPAILQPHQPTPLLRQVGLPLGRLVLQGTGCNGLPLTSLPLTQAPFFHDPCPKPSGKMGWSHSTHPLSDSYLAGELLQGRTALQFSILGP